MNGDERKRFVTGEAWRPHATWINEVTDIIEGRRTVGFQDVPPPSRDASPTRPVQIYHNTTLGKCVQKNSYGFHPGRVRTWAEGTAAAGDDVWVKIIDGDGEQTTREQSELAGCYAGSVEAGSSTRPLYVVQQGALTFKAKADGTITAGNSGTVSIWTVAADSLVNVTAYFHWMDDGGSDITVGMELLIKWFADEAKWTIVERQC